jgi:hypothetical protein
MCPAVVGTAVGFDEEINTDLTGIDGGGGINPNYLTRDPNNGCKPIYPHNFTRVNTMFEVVKANGGYASWSDKHPALTISTTVRAAQAWTTSILPRSTRLWWDYRESAVVPR